MTPIGRDAETVRITRFLGDLPRGCRALLIEGEAGIGKTTVLNEGRTAAVQLGITVLSAYPVESEVPLEFAGLADLLETVPSVVDELPGPQRQAVRQAVLRLEPLQDPADPRTTATAVLTLLRTLARKQPVVVIVDELPWLDTPSARALSFALRRLRLEPVGVLAAVRTDWSGCRPRLATDSIPAERMDHLSLGPLSLGAIRELLATRTTLSPSRSLLLRLHETSGGNPLFALELAARLHAGMPPGPHEILDVPESLRRLVLGRISGLSPGTRDVLLVSSLSTEPVLPVICAAVPDPATAYVDLEEGIQTGLVTNADAKVAFVHPLVRSLIAEQARPADRRAAHRRLAAVVGSPEARARHLALAAEGPDEAAAAELEAAARMAGRRGASDTAGDLLELSVSLTPLALRHSQQRRTVLAAEERFEAADPAQACRLLKNIIDTMPAGPARAELLRRAARYRAFCGEPMAAWTTALRSALHEAGDDDTALRAVILMDQAVAASHAASFREAIHSAEMVFELAGQAGDKALEAQCCAVLAFATFLSGNGLRPDLMSRALAGPQQPPRLSMDLRPGVVVGHILHWTDDLDGARVLYQQEYDRAVEQGVKTGLPFVLWALAENEGWAGNWSRAEHMVADGCSLAEDSGSPAAIAFILAVRGLLQVYRGRIDAGLGDAARAVELAVEMGMPLVAAMAAQAFGIAALSAGDPGSAHERLGPFAEATLAVGVAEPALCRFLPDEIEALTRLGELGVAEELLGRFEARSAQLGRRWGVAAAGRCRGLLLAARGDLASGLAALAVALEGHRRLAMPFEEARTLLVAGEVHRRSRHKHKALVCFQAALAIFERLGAPPWQARVCDELARLGTRSTPSGAGPGLTAAEQRVGELVAAGRTNSEVAAELFMGLRTVEAHLSRMYRKLSVRSRTELCRMLTSPGPPRAP